MTKIFGVTGGIGSGKSTVCEILESFGARVFRADDVGKQVMTDDYHVRQEISEAFGVDSYSLGGELNTEYLARVVFADPEQVQAIEAIVHPRVLGLFGEAKSMARRDGIPSLVLESALMFQSGACELVDLVIVVDTPDRARIARVVERDGVVEADVRARMAHQLSRYEMRKGADHIIENSGSLHELRDTVADLYRRIIADL